MGDPGAVPADALEHVAYLSRSENRVRVLEALAAEPHTRRELQERTEASRTTLGRILTELDERGWAERTADGDYAVTPRGAHVVREFGPFLAAMEVICEFGETVAWLPTDELDVSLRQFGDATVRRPESNAPTEAGRHLADALRGASTFRALTFIAPPQAVGAAIRDAALGGDLTAEHVFAGSLVDYIRDNPEGPPPWRDYIEAGARIYRYDGRLPCNLFVVDGAVLFLKNRSGHGRVGTAIESRNGTVRSRALELFERYRDDAERVPAEAFERG